MNMPLNKIQHINSITHEGKVVVVATDADGKIWYTVKQDGFEDSYLNKPTNGQEQDNPGWEDWQELEFPNEEKDQSVIDRETEELTREDKSFILRSCYQTREQSAVAPVQLVSGLGHLYVFRQSKENTLLVDRFVLDGLTNKLTRKLEVRFKRSRQKYEPSKKQKKTNEGLANIDSLDFRDINDRDFYEPTTELCMVNNLFDGWFSVVLLPTNEQDKHRWHIFAYNSKAKKVEITTLRASDEGLFEVKDYTILEPDPGDQDTLKPRIIPGIIKRTLDFGKKVQVANGLTATKYDIQRERQTENGRQLLRESVRVMLVVGTTAGNVAALSFAVAADGTLSKIDEEPSEDILRSKKHQVLLPPDTLDRIRAIGSTQNSIQGDITRLERGEEDVITITASGVDQIDEAEVTQVSIKDTHKYDDVYTQVARIDDNTFEITPAPDAAAGKWEQVQPEDTGLVYDGILTGYEIRNGALRVTAYNHGLENGDSVQIVDTKDYNGTYTITKIDDQKFSLDGVRWQAGTAINARIQSQKRRGVQFDGVGDHIEIPPLEWQIPAVEKPFGLTYSAWVYVDSASNESIIMGKQDQMMRLAIQDGKLNLIVQFTDGVGQVVDDSPITTGKWLHCAATLACNGEQKTHTVVLIKDGNEVARKDFQNKTLLSIQSALAFDEGTDHVFLPGERGVDFRKLKSWTVEAWIKPGSYTDIGSKIIFSYTLPHKDPILLFLQPDSGNVCFSSNGNIIAADSAPLNQWTHVAVVYREDQRSSLYVNGIEAGTTSDAPRIAFEGENLNISIGAYSAPVESEEVKDIFSRLTSFVGQIAEVRIWSTARETEEIKSTINRRLSGDEPGLVGYYPFLNGTADDHSPTGNHGILVGNPKPVNESGLLVGKAFAGKIAEVQVWDGARTPEAINSSKYLQLTGQEIGLLGYWRLDAIVEEKARRVLDFSVNGNDGVVQGDPYVSAVTLRRNLADGIPAVKYENEELFAVSERARYTEEFEFKVLPDAKGRIFSFAYKGKKSRRSPDWIEIKNTEDSTFTQLDNGWWKASASFTVPDGVSMVRSFGIDEIKGDWETLEIRKHKIRLVSDTITEKAYADSLDSLKQLGTAVSESGELLIELERLELQQGRLTLEQRKWERRISELLKNIERAKESTRKKIETQQTAIAQIQKEKDYWSGEVERANQEVTFYWKNGLSGDHFSRGIGQYPTMPNNWNDEVASIRVPEGLYVILYEHTSFRGGRLKFNVNHNLSDWKIPGTSTNWKNETSSFIVGTKQPKDPNTKPENLDDTQKYDKSKLGNHDLYFINRMHAYSTNNLQIAKKHLAEFEAELKDLNATDSDKVTTALSEVKDKLAKAREKSRNSNENLLSKISPQNVQTLPQIFKDSKGLLTQGALLEFVRPVSRLSAIETCEGNVQLSYFDDRGRMRQTNYDAAADSNNSTFDQWIPDSLRTCLNFNLDSSVVTLENPVHLEQEWTIEAWFAYPLPDTSQWNTLVRGKDIDGCIGDHHVIVHCQGNAERLGIYLNNNGDFKFVDSGYDMKQLSPGWYHLTAVAKGDTTLFYIDGMKVGDTKDHAKKIAQEELDRDPKNQQAKDKVEKTEQAILKTSSNIYALGNYQGGGQPFGKVAEVRIWGVALSDEEIAVNSKSLLTGNEPGLLAYYPFTEAAGTMVRNHSTADEDDKGNDHNGTMENASWWGCVAPIGKLDHQVIQFDGENDNIATSTSLMNTLSAFTMEGWIKAFSLPDATNVSLFGQNDVIEFGISAGNLSVWISNGHSITAEGEFPLADWHHVAVVGDGMNLTLYLDGAVVQSSPASTSNYGTSSDPFKIGAGVWHGGIEEPFKGQMADVRLWNKARSMTEIRADMNKRLTGKESGLLAYYPLNEINVEGSTNKVRDHTPNNHDGIVTEAVLIRDQSLPLASSALVSAEYSTVGLDPDTGQKTAMMRRFLAAPEVGGVTLLPDKRIEELDLQWIGNAQFAPSLLGYIEGPPPVPSENLTLSDDYNGATSVELTMSEDVEYSWKRSDSEGGGVLFDMWIGKDEDIRGGVAVTKKITKTRLGAKGDLNITYLDQGDSTVGSFSSLKKTDKLELRGTPEQDAHFPHLGNRFIPKNVGYALVISAVADVFITRLRRSKRMIGYQVQPVEGIPPDVNTITFLINPAYTMSGSLDGLTGSSATSQRFFKHVPAMRAQYGSLYPASYYRLKEADNLKSQIEERDKGRESFFAQFGTGTNRYLGDEKVSTASPVPALNREEDKPDNELTEAEKAAEERELKRISDETAAASASQSEIVKQKQADIKKQIADQQKRTHASESFSSWQKNMESIRNRAAKRNIVNTYVWDADGGLHIEAQDFANTIEHSTGSSWSTSLGLGGEGKLHLGGVWGVELTAQARMSLTYTYSKTESRSRGIELNVDLSGVESRGITDYNDYPILPGEKVGRYRFMSFYLEGSNNHYKDFFNYVVDPEWLAGNSEEARALRQAKGNLNETWRVLHRVTYVERPALMGFGRDLRNIRSTNGAAGAASINSLQKTVAELQKDNEHLNKKLDLILWLLKSQTNGDGTAPADGRSAVVVVDDLNIRKNHSTEAVKVGTLDKGDKVLVRDQWTKDGNTWVQLGPDRWAAMVYEGKTYIKFIDH